MALNYGLGVKIRKMPVEVTYYCTIMSFDHINTPKSIFYPIYLHGVHSTSLENIKLSQLPNNSCIPVQTKYLSKVQRSRLSDKLSTFLSDFVYPPVPSSFLGPNVIRTRDPQTRYLSKVSRQNSRPQSVLYSH